MPGTHEVELGPARVVKRYRAWNHDQPRREWRALVLLAEHAPGLAPEPVHADLTAEPPTVVMTRLAGSPLETPVRDGHLDALAEAIDLLQRAVPAEVLNGLPRRAGHPREMLDLLRRRCAGKPPPDGDPLVTKAHEAATAWIERPSLERVFDDEPAGVFGTGDGNLANHLWDGTRVRTVDYEYAGRTDRAYELAETVEHITARTDDALDAENLLSRFPLTTAERARLTECRRLLAVFWFPPHASERQAAHVLSLLNEE